MHVDKLAIARVIVTRHILLIVETSTRECELIDLLGVLDLKTGRFLHSIQKTGGVSGDTGGREEVAWVAWEYWT